MSANPVLTFASRLCAGAALALLLLTGPAFGAPSATVADDPALAEIASALQTTIGQHVILSNRTYRVEAIEVRPNGPRGYSLHIRVRLVR